MFKAESRVGMVGWKSLRKVRSRKKPRHCGHRFPDQIFQAHVDCLSIYLKPWVLSAFARAALGFVGFVYFAQWAVYKNQYHWF